MKENKKKQEKECSHTNVFDGAIYKVHIESLSINYKEPQVNDS